MGKWQRPDQRVSRTVAPIVAGPLMEPTPEDIKNGWTAETLTAYHAERKRAHDGKIARDPTYRPPVRPTVANGRYSVLRRGR